MSKSRLSVSVDAALLEAGRRAVEDGRAPSLSSWVSQALARQVEVDRRRSAADEFDGWYDAHHEPITADEVAEAERWAATAAVAVRPRGTRRPRSPRVA